MNTNVCTIASGHRYLCKTKEWNELDAQSRNLYTSITSSCNHLSQEFLQEGRQLVDSPIRKVFCDIQNLVDETLGFVDNCQRRCQYVLSWQGGRQSEYSLGPSIGPTTGSLLTNALVEPRMYLLRLIRFFSMVSRSFVRS